MKRSYIIAILVILLIAVGFFYWYLLLRAPVQSPASSSTTQSGGFQPFGSAPTASNSNAAPQGTNAVANPAPTAPGAPVPVLRLLSNTPVGGYAASTTASTTVIRWVDRGRGNIYEAGENNLNIMTISNTLLPRVYQSQWNSNASAFVGSVFENGDGQVSTVYAQVVPQPASTATDTASFTPYALKGKNLPANVIAYALSPNKSQLFTLIDESGTSVGYISGLDGSKMTKIFDTPLSEVNVQWPEANTIAITTKGTASQEGYLYFVNPKTGVWKKVAGPLLGLSAVVSHDAKYALVSYTDSNQGIDTSIYTTTTGQSVDAVIRTLADKCAWGNFYTEMVYCAVPSQPAAAAYPDDWYMGLVSFTDKIWQVNASTGEVHLLSSIVDQSDRVIDGFNLGLDSKDNYLVFMNKNDLSLWSLNLVASSH